MGRAKAIIFAALLAVPLGFAQDDGIRATTQGGRAVRNGADQSVNIQGCLSSSALGDNAFTLTQDQTGKVYRLAGNLSDLASHAGHEILITGSSVPVSQSTESSIDTTGSASTTEPSTIQVSGAQMISDHCSRTGTTPPPTKMSDGEPQTAKSTDDRSPLATVASGESAQPETQPKPDGNNPSSEKTTPRPQSDSNLPQTATILPLLGLVGLSSLVTGFIFRVR